MKIIEKGIIGYILLSIAVACFYLFNFKTDTHYFLTSARIGLIILPTYYLFTTKMDWAWIAFIGFICFPLGELFKFYYYPYGPAIYAVGLFGYLVGAIYILINHGVKKLNIVGKISFYMMSIGALFYAIEMLSKNQMLGAEFATTLQLLIFISSIYALLHTPNFSRSSSTCLVVLLLVNSILPSAIWILRQIVM